MWEVTLAPWTAGKFSGFERKRSCKYIPESSVSLCLTESQYEGWDPKDLMVWARRKEFRVCRSQAVLMSSLSRLTAVRLAVFIIYFCYSPTLYFYRYGSSLIKNASNSLVLQPSSSVVEVFDDALRSDRGRTCGLRLLYISSRCGHLSIRPPDSTPSQSSAQQANLSTVCT